MIVSAAPQTFRQGSNRAASTKHPGLIALEAPAKLGGEGEMPTRLVMLKWGVNQTSIDPKTVGLKTLQASKLWDHIVPVSRYPEFANELANLQLMPAMQNRSKGNRMGAAEFEKLRELQESVPGVTFAP